MYLVITFNTEEDKALIDSVQEKLVANGCLWVCGATHMSADALLEHGAKLFQIDHENITWGKEVHPTRDGLEYKTMDAAEYLLSEPVEPPAITRLIITFQTEEDRALIDKVQEKLVANGCLWRSGDTHIDLSEREVNVFQIDSRTIVFGRKCVPVEDGIRYKTLTAREYLGVKEESAEKPSILQTAETILNGDRQADYSDPVKNFENIAKLASIITGKELTPEECCVVLMCVKLIREGFKHKEDNLVDLAAYAEILNRIKSK